MMRTLSTSLVLVGALAVTGLSMLTGPDLPPAGSAAPVIEAASWYNHIGRNPDLNSLRGKAVLLEFWATW